MVYTVVEPTAADRQVRKEARPSSTCLKCPVCGSEECVVLQELGMYCDTKTAAEKRDQPVEELWATYGVG